MSRKRTDRRMVWICGGQFVCQKSGCTAFLRKGPVRPAKRFPPSEKIPAEGFGDKFGPLERRSSRGAGCGGDGEIRTRRGIFYCK